MTIEEIQMKHEEREFTLNTEFGVSLPGSGVRDLSPHPRRPVSLDTSKTPNLECRVYANEGDMGRGFLNCKNKTRYVTTIDPSLKSRTDCLLVPVSSALLHLLLLRAILLLASPQHIVIL